LELAKCIQDVHARAAEDYIDLPYAPLLFKKGHIYPVFKDETNNWLTTDEEGFQHIVASGVELVIEDYWFSRHFTLL
jgi:hypothetical protein